jgi:ATP-dependent DNA helicase PIF1
MRIKKGGDGQPSCRFYYPRQEREQPAILTGGDSDMNPKHWMFHAAQNHTNLNPFNRLLMLCWLANTDTSPIPNSRVVLDYMGKYVTKGETATTSYNDMVKTILPKIAENKGLESLITRLMNQLIGERDWSAQEVSHILLDLPLQQGSRVVETVDCRPEEQQTTFFRADHRDEESTIVNMGLSKLQKYKQGPEQFEDVTFLDFVLHYYHNASVNKIRKPPRAKPWVLNYFPRYDPDKETQAQDYFRVKVMLHHPFRDTSHLLLMDLINISGPAFTTWQARWRQCVGTGCESNHQPDYLELPSAAAEDDEFEPAEGEEDNIDASWHEIARQRPNDEGIQVES